MTTAEALEELQRIATQPTRYLLHLCNSGHSRNSLCGLWVGDLVGKENNHRREVVASPETLHQWSTHKYELCWECEGHEDYPMFLLGAV